MKKTILSILGVIAASAVVQPVFAEAIWTTVIDGSEVNFNIYASKDDVYLNGGPGKGAGTNAKGLPDGTYVFMVTDPPGKVLLSTDNARCRQVTVSGGVFSAVVPASGCEHVTGLTSAGYITVQLMPYSDTPNKGGEYKVWLTNVLDYTCPLTVRDCTRNRHGFVPSDSKTDNFKVGPRSAHEIDTRFFDANGVIMDGLGVKWFDSLGASNNKWSYYAPAIFVNHEAHVEAPEVGTHKIQINDQLRCQVQEVYVASAKTRKNGPQVVKVRITQSMINKGVTTFIDVHCK
ncbi:MAG: hypothetical protein ACR65R_17345 [Methylomicrobium sp.]